MFVADFIIQLTQEKKSVWICAERLKAAGACAQIIAVSRDSCPHRKLVCWRPCPRSLTRVRKPINLESFSCCVLSSMIVKYDAGWKRCPSPI